MSIALSVYVDDLDHVTVDDGVLHRGRADNRISAHLHYSGFSLWGYQPGALRALAQSLTEAADKLEAAHAEQSAAEREAAS
jgi:hypothetical protein